jgi:hypothetical protein
MSSNCNTNKDPDKKFRITVVKQPAGAEVQARGLIYDSQLGEILKTGDVHRFRNFLSQTGHALPDDMMLDLLRVETVMHQLILNRPDLSEFHANSKDWLDNHTVLGSSGVSLREASEQAEAEMRLREQAQLATKTEDSKSKKRVIYLRTFNAN